jgi:hypothetical protein
VKVERVGRANGGYQESANKSNADGIHEVLSVVMAVVALGVTGTLLLVKTRWSSDMRIQEYIRG